jgi:hypothetical protein
MKQATKVPTVRLVEAFVDDLVFEPHRPIPRGPEAQQALKPTSSEVAVCPQTVSCLCNPTALYKQVYAGAKEIKDAQNWSDWQDYLPQKKTSSARDANATNRHCCFSLYMVVPCTLP